MRRRRLVTAAMVACMIPALVGILGFRLLESNRILGRVAAGAGRMSMRMIGNALPVDAQIGRAFVLDDGVPDSEVPAFGGGRSYFFSSSSSTANKIHVIDTRTGKLVAAVTVASTVSAIAVDATTHRLFAFDTQAQRLQVLDARDGRLLRTIPFDGNSGANQLTTATVNAVAIDARSGALFVATSAYNPPFDQQVLMLDGHTGEQLHRLTLPTTSSSASATTFYAPALSLSADARTARIYVFDAGKQMRALDGATGRVLFTRRLPFTIEDAAIAGLSGRIFAFEATQGPFGRRGYFGAGRRARPGTLVILDAQTGAILRTMPGGTTGGGSIAIDEQTNRAFVTNPASGTVSVLDATSGRLLRTVAAGTSPSQVLLDAPHRRVLVSTYRDGRITVLDARDGSPIRTISAGQQGENMAVDPQTGHIVATTSAIRSSDRWGWLPGGLRGHVPGVPPPPSTSDPSTAIAHHEVLTIDPS